MCVGYDPSSDDPCPYSDLDEYLCEYVDGEMDRAVRASFEEYLRSDPALAVHVEHLREAREMLCAYGCRIGAPCGVQSRLRERVSHDEMQIPLPLFSSVAARLGLFASCTSLIALLLIGGVMVYETEDQVSPASQISSTAPGWNHMHVLAPRVPASRPAWQITSPAAPGFTLAGSSTGAFSAIRPVLPDTHYAVLASAQLAVQQVGWMP